MISLNISFNGDKQLISIIDAKAEEVKSGLIRFGRLTLTRMHNEIKSRTKRRGSTGRLISSIRMQVENPTPTLSFVHIGNKATMTKEAPYWYVVNYGMKFTGGKFIPPATVGSFEGDAPSQSSGKNQRWGSHKPGFYMKPRTFRPLHYIERTYSWVVNYWPKYWSLIIK